MPYFPQTPTPARPPRVRFPKTTSVVVRKKDNACVPAKLELVSITGGLLELTRPLDRGTNVRLLFLLGKGTVFSVAEMLAPVSWTQQPFRFVTLYDDDKRRLKAEIQLTLQAKPEKHVEIERTRAW